MSSLPILREGNIVTYASDEELRASVEAYLSKGGLDVRPEVALEPLALVEVRLLAPRRQEPLVMRCEVVVLQEGREAEHPPAPALVALVEGHRARRRGDGRSARVSLRGDQRP